MYYGISRAVRKEIVDQLRIWFSGTEPITQEWKYTSDLKTTKIQIFDEYPQEEAFRPCVIVLTGGSGQTSEYGLGQLEETIYQDATAYYKFGGKVRITVTITVESYTKPNMESLADVIIVGFADGGAVRGKLQEQGITLEPEAFVRIGGENEKELTSTRKIYGVTLSFPVLANWKRITEIPGEIMTDSELDLTKETL